MFKARWEVPINNRQSLYIEDINGELSFSTDDPEKVVRGVVVARIFHPRGATCLLTEGH